MPRMNKRLLILLLSLDIRRWIGHHWRSHIWWHRGHHWRRRSHRHLSHGWSHHRRHGHHWRCAHGHLPGRHDRTGWHGHLWSGLAHIRWRYAHSLHADLTSFVRSCRGVDQVLCLFLHPFLIIELDVILVLAALAVGLPHRRRIVRQVRVAIITIVFRHGCAIGTPRTETEISIYY